MATGDSSQPDQTRHPDVCGSVDELKGILTDNPDMAKEEPDTLFQLLDDSKHMIRRMHRRRTEYEAFVQAVSSLCEQAEDPDVEQAYEAADRIRAALSERPAQVTRELADLHSLAETVRRIAQQQEKCLKHYKDLSVGITELCEEIRGERDWRSQE